MDQKYCLPILEIGQARSDTCLTSNWKWRLINSKNAKQFQKISCARFVQFIFCRMFLIMHGDNLTIRQLINKFESFGADRIRCMGNEGISVLSQIGIGFCLPG